MNETTSVSHTPNQTQSVTLEIQRFYVKEQTCKVPHGSQTFQTSGQPENAMEMNINSQSIAKDIFEVTLHITLSSKAQQRTLYTVDVQQAGIVKIQGQDDSSLAHLINVYMPALLYPYIRKVIADAIYNAGFAPTFLPPVDFASMYAQRIQAKDSSSLDAIKDALSQPTPIITDKTVLN